MNDLEDVNIVDTSSDKGNGQTKCPQCGATEISLNTKTGKLRCNFCRHEFEPEKLDNMETDVENLKGRVVGSGAQNMTQDSENIITLKCTSCGAEVVIDTNESTQARCHWCRNTLSINEKIPNGAVPDVVLPFKTNRNEAKEKINAFVGKRKFYAHPKFKQEFTTDNVMGVYLPYMIVDINGHSRLVGEGEIKKRSYKVKSGDSEKTYYDADVYNVDREFDIAIEGLTVESSLDKLNNDSGKTNNIINSIMPFDTENAVKWDANYLKGYTSEKRDTNIDDLEEWTHIQAEDIARYKINDDIKQYDRGVCWKSEDFDVNGEQWKAAYLPVWLYSYQEVKGNGKKLLHYVAVNARTNETMGSIPIHMPKLFLISVIVEIVGIFAGLFVNGIFYEDEYNWPFWVSFFTGVIYFIAIYSKYRNTGAKHHHESETKANIKNIRRSDVYVKERKKLSSSTIEGANNYRVSTKKNIVKK